MPSLKDIKRRIKSVKNTKQITKAMKMVSAAKLKRAQDEITAARPYAASIQELTLSLSSTASPDSHPLLSSKAETNKVAALLLTSDRGLCGSFNAVILRTVERFLRERDASDTNLYLLGRRGVEYFKRSSASILQSRPLGSKRPQYADAVKIAEVVMESFLKGEVKEVYMVYTEFKSALTQRPVAQRILPISTPPAEAENQEAQEKHGIEPIFEPSREALLSSLLPRYVQIQVFKAMLESAASEHGARMTAMDSASKNATQMMGALTLKYNRLRQAAITKELMEIIGGAEALK
ncbi:MAG: ATP synthase F1 subunit gamma [Deltaproteobacteria bacterium]|nr:ATP synthase F1 subunit gamma [Deltaproteobacteria bacterium]